MKRGNSDFQYGNNMVPVKWFVNRAVAMVGACLGEYNKVSVHAQRLSKIKTAMWVVFIPMIKKQLLTNWTTSHLVI